VNKKMQEEVKSLIADVLARKVAAPRRKEGSSPFLLKKFPKISEEESYEFETYIRSLASSSDRVRHVVIISVVASVLVFAAYRRSEPGSWWNERVKVTHTVDAQGLLPKKEAADAVPAETVSFLTEFGKKATRDIEEELNECQTPHRDFGRVRTGAYCDKVRSYFWLRVKEHSRGTFEWQASSMEHANTSELIWVEVPFLGIKFDINDLGTFSAIGQSIISFMLLYSIARHHENLYLCLWKVRRVAQSENRFNDGQSKANFLYHAMAMTQVLTRPPTLARWADRSVTRVPPLILFTIPVFVQLLVLINDRKTAFAGNLFSPRLAWQSFAIHLFFGVAILIMTICVMVLSRAADVRWRNTFFEINPSFINMKAVGRLAWLMPRGRRLYRFVHGKAVAGATQFSIVELHNKKHWVIPTVVTGRSIEIPSSSDNVRDWYFNPLIQDDGRLYQVKGMSGESLEITSMYDEDDMRQERWTVRRAAVLSTDPPVLIEAVGERLFKYQQNQPPPKVPICTARDPEKSLASSQRGILDVAASLDPELVLFVDTAGRLLRVDNGDLKRFGPEAPGWSAVAVTCHDGRVYVAEKKRRWLEHFRLRDVVRIRVLDPVSEAEETAINLKA
jgi:hypothetical protein